MEYDRSWGVPKLRGSVYYDQRESGPPFTSHYIFTLRPPCRGRLVILDQKELLFEKL